MSTDVPCRPDGDDTIVITVHVSSGAQFDPSPAPSPFFTQQARAMSVTWQPTTTERHSVNTTNNDHLPQPSFDAPNHDCRCQLQQQPGHTTSPAKQTTDDGDDLACQQRARLFRW